MITATTAADLLRLICLPENFGDDGLRLAYADLCEEEGQAERAEFVRVQFAVARVEAAEPAGHHWLCKPGTAGYAGCARCEWLLGHDRLRELRQQERRLLNRLRPKLCAELPSPKPDCHGWGLYLARHADGMDDPYTLALSRGFVSEAAMPCAAWLAHGPALVRRQPVERVRLTDREPASGDPDLGPGWFWYTDSHNWGAASARVPRQLVPAFNAAVKASRSGAALGSTALFLDEAEATNAMSFACLAYARATEPTS